MKKFSKLQLNKKTIAKMNDAQLNAVRGGQKAIGDDSVVVNCNGQGATIVNTKISD